MYSHARRGGPAVGRGRGAYYANKYGRGRGRGGGGGGGAANDFHNSGDPSQFKRLGSCDDLANFLKKSDNGPYPRYKGLIGEWELIDGVLLYFDRIQSDPYAPPSRARVRVELGKAAFDKQLYSSRIRRVAFCDFLTRKFWRAVRGEGMDVGRGGGGWGGSKGGDLNVDRPSQHVLERSSCLMVGDAIEMRFTVNLPARGRSIEGREAATLLTEKLPVVVKKVLFVDGTDSEALRNHVVSVEDQEYLREKALKDKGLIAFVVDGAVLPRQSGAEDEPMTGKEVVKFKSPGNLAVEIELPSGKKVRGMGIKPGISLIVGGGFHGKSTLLSALEVGVYDHIPGDGREFVCVEPSTVSIRAEDGRSVNGVDITPFINNLPFGKQTDCFSTGDASGSTSQAANIMEALEAGAKVLLTDEDLAATNFMMRDDRMQQLVPADKEPITPMIQRIRSLYEDEGVSSILVIGGTGDYFGVSDLVVMMDCYVPKDVTKEAKAIAGESPCGVSKKAGRSGIFKKKRARRISRESIRRVKNSGRGRSCAKVKGTVEFGNVELDLSAVSQIVETSQTRAIAAALESLGEMEEIEKSGITECVKELMKEVDEKGCDGLSQRGERMGNLSRPRGIEVQAALSRLRRIETKK